MVAKPKSKNKKVNSKYISKPVQLNQIDIDIIKLLRNGSVEVINIHDKLEKYSDQEVSLNLSSLEDKKFIKKVIFTHPTGDKIISYQLDALGKNFMYKK